MHEHRLEHGEVREPDRVAGAAPLVQTVCDHGRRDDEQRQQQERMAERHFATQIRSSWTTACVFERMASATTPLRIVCVTCTPRAARADGGVCPKKPIACVALLSRSRAGQRARTVRLGVAGTLRTWRSTVFPGGIALGSYAVGARCPPPDAGTQPMCGRKLAAGTRPRTRRPRKTASRDVVMPGLTGLPSVPMKPMSMPRVESSASRPATT